MIKESVSSLKVKLLEVVDSRIERLVFDWIQFPGDRRAIRHQIDLLKRFKKQMELLIPDEEDWR